MWKRDRADRNFFDRPLGPEPAATFAAPSPTPPAPVAREQASPTPSPAAREQATSPPLASDARAEIPPARKAAVAAGAPRGSVLGATLRFKGELVADEDLVVQGHVEGSILHTRSLTIGPDGVMHGDIRARRIVVEGTVAGDLYALECVTVRATGHVNGSIYAPRVAIAEGAQFNGRVDMAHAPAVPSPVLAAATHDEPAARAAATAAGAEATLDDLAVDDLLDGGSAAGQ